MGDTGETLSYQDRTQLSLNRTETNLRLFYHVSMILTASGVDSGAGESAKRLAFWVNFILRQHFRHTR